MATETAQNRDGNDSPVGFAMGGTPTVPRNRIIHRHIPSPTPADTQTQLDFLLGMRGQTEIAQNHDESDWMDSPIVQRTEIAQNHDMIMNFNGMQTEIAQNRGNYDRIGFGDFGYEDSIPMEFQLAQTELEKEIVSLKNEIELLRKQQTSPHQTQHDDAFWSDIGPKLIESTDFIKSLLRSGEMTVFDETPSTKKTLLIMASRYGNYEIAQLALNLGADIDHRDSDHRTALDHAKQQNQHHIIQLLTLSKMEANVSKRVSDTAQNINKQNGIIDTMTKHISYLKNKKMFIDTLTDMMCKIITNKECFDDTLLVMVLRLQSNPPSSTIYKTLISVCTEIIQGNNKRDWHWFKCFIIPSKVWYETYGTDHHKYFDLLNIVNKKSNSLLSKLDRKLKHSDHWDELLTCDMSDQDIQQDVQPRQDQIMNGIQSKFTKTEVLKHGGSSSTFNSAKHYDQEVYLPELISLAHSVDDVFHDSVRNIFAVDKVTNIGFVETDSDEKDDRNEQSVIYKRGPVKLTERARAKADGDYNQQKYPTTACVVDLNRCSLVFGSIHSLLNGLRLFTNKVSHYKAGNIIDITRVKNGFKEYLKQKQYADIKLNVVIKGKHQCIIGEVQFLLQTMAEFKIVAHNLYSIQREEEFITQSVERIFPILLDLQKVIKVAGIMGDTKQLLQIMSNNNLSMGMILKPDEQNQTILTDICSQGHIKAFKMIKGMMSSSMLIECLLDVVSKSNYNPVEMAIRRNRSNILKEIFDMKGIQTIFQTNSDKTYRALWWLFKSNKNVNGIVEVLKSNLKITAQRWKTLLRYPYEESVEGLDPTCWDINGKDGTMLYHINKNEAALEALRQLNFTIDSNVMDVIANREVRKRTELTALGMVQQVEEAKEDPNPMVTLEDTIKAVKDFFLN
eukprot:873623_1